VWSATSRQQPPQWSVVGQVDCFSPSQPVWVEVVLHLLHPGHSWSPQRSIPVHRRWGSQKLCCSYKNDLKWPTNDVIPLPVDRVLEKVLKLNLKLSFLVLNALLFLRLGTCAAAARRRHVAWRLIVHVVNNYRHFGLRQQAQFCHTTTVWTTSTNGPARVSDSSDEYALLWDCRRLLVRGKIRLPKGKTS